MVSSLQHGYRHDIEKFIRNHSYYDPHTTSCAMHMTEDTHNIAIKVTLRQAVHACNILYRWELAFSIIAFVIGIPGNLMLAVTALSLERMKSSIYISFLAVGDLLALLSQAFTPTTHGNRSFTMYKRSVGIIPNMILVFICVERYLSVSNPWFTRRHLTSKAMYGSILVLALCYIIFLAVTIPINDLLGQTTDEPTLLVNFLSFGIPFPFILTFNCLTVKHIKRIHAGPVNVAVHLEWWTQVEISVTYMMVLSSTMFLILNGPLFLICLFGLIAKLTFTEEPFIYQTTLDFFLNISYWLTFIQHSINFYLYVLGSKRFRKQWLHLTRTFVPKAIKKRFPFEGSPTSVSAANVSLQHAKETGWFTCASGGKDSLRSIGGTETNTSSFISDYRMDNFKLEPISNQSVYDT